MGKKVTAKLGKEDTTPAQQQLRLTEMVKFDDSASANTLDDDNLPDQVRREFKLHKRLSEAVSTMLDLAAIQERQAKLLPPGQRARLKVQKVVKEKLYAKYLPPMKRIATLKPNLFNDEPRVAPCLNGKSLERIGFCYTCERSPYKGWGS